jgi:glycosyltransferase involved in cell wall biosynthesis
MDIRVSNDDAEAKAATPVAVAQVAVITRTKNRPILLRRALESVRRQTFCDYTWVIVNDGGERSGVETIAEQAKTAGVRTVVIHNAESLGMEAASNAGIHAVDSQYIVIHDDDDSWAPAFLERTTKYLIANPCYAGVVTQSMRVDETIDSETVRILAQYPFNRRLANICLVDVLSKNRFPPISFLYRRDAFDAVGDYDPSLPVLGDWEFNIRFLEKYDIGVIPEILANYHHRVRGSWNDVYGNTVISGIQEHLRYDAIIRNRMVRRDLAAGRFGIGGLLSIVRSHQTALDEQGTLADLMQTAKRIAKRLLVHSGVYRWFRK